MVVEAAPRRDAVEIADVVDLRQAHELFPGEREPLFHIACYFEAPTGERDVRLLTEIENGPVVHLVLADWQLRHPMPIRRSGALGAHAAEPDVHALVQGDLALNVFEASFDEIIRHAGLYPFPTTTVAGRRISSPIA
jgi:hypothetical protein